MSKTRESKLSYSIDKSESHGQALYAPFVFIVSMIRGRGRVRAAEAIQPTSNAYAVESLELPLVESSSLIS